MVKVSLYFYYKKIETYPKERTLGKPLTDQGFSIALEAPLESG